MILTFLYFLVIINPSIVLTDRLYNENCETLNSEIHIVKDEYYEDGKLLRTCSGDISVSKCEGYCNSHVQPSITTTMGFLKECFCCREGSLEERLIFLNQCYDLDGTRIRDTEDATMEVRIKEPADCKCFKCGLY